MPRVAKLIAHSGYCSRREAERLILAGEVSIDGKLIESPALNLTDASGIHIRGKPLPNNNEPQIWIFHKPTGCLTTRHDPQGRTIIYDHLPEHLQQFHPIGRLDYNSEGLLLLTNSSEWKQYYESPASKIPREYRVRVKGKVTQKTQRQIEAGVTIEGIRYRSARLHIEHEGNSNSWLNVTLYEGKNREIRRIFEHFNHPVSRLIRVGYGQHRLDRLPIAHVVQSSHDSGAEKHTDSE